jgi:hypothetical protein
VRESRSKKAESADEQQGPWREPPESVQRGAKLIARREFLDERVREHYRAESATLIISANSILN